jgi:hypothetical protein
MPHFCTCGIFNIQGLTCGHAVYVLASDDHFVVWWSVRQDHLCTLRTRNAPSTCHRVRTGNIGIRSSILVCEYIVEKRLFMHTKCACAQVSLDIGADAVCSSRQPLTLTNVEDNGNLDLYLHPNFLELCLRSRSPRQAQPLNRQTLSLLATDTPRYTETMVFFPDQPEDMFKYAFNDWEYRRDVAPANRNDVGLSTAAAQPSIGTAQASTSSTSPVDRTCTITSDFISEDGYKIQYKRGMQGHFLGESTTSEGIRMAKIFIQGTTEHGPDKGQANKWVPVDKIEIGPHWKPDLKDDV